MAIVSQLLAACCYQGPKTIHFWAPTFKWAISIANLADLQRPPENVSYPQQFAVTATGVIWSRFATQITPVRARDKYSAMPLASFLILPASCHFPADS